MQVYIGTKIIRATPMTDLEFEIEKAEFNKAKGIVNTYKKGGFLLRHGQAMCCDNAERREPKDGYKVMYPDGYTSWSPKDVFEGAYRLITGSERELI